MFVWARGTYFAHVNQTAHQILIAECVDGVLCLLSCRVFHDSAPLLPKNQSVNHNSATSRNSQSSSHDKIYLAHSALDQENVCEEDFTSCERKSVTRVTSQVKFSGAYLGA